MLYIFMVNNHYTLGSRLNLPWKVFRQAVPVDKIMSLFNPLLYASGAAGPLLCPAATSCSVQKASLPQPNPLAPCRGRQILPFN